MNDAQKQFLAREYQALWKAYGALPYTTAKLSAGDIPETGESSSALDGEGIESPVSCETPATDIAVPTLEAVRARLAGGCGCELCPGRKNLVFGAGSPTADLMFVGDGPGAEEDAQGLPFVGNAGELLTKIIEAMGRKREAVYLTNVVKCRPPQNRQPTPEETGACAPTLRGQILAVRPRVVVALGPVAAQLLTGEQAELAELRGRFHSLVWDASIAVLPTFHPSYLLRQPQAKKIVWEDMKQVMVRLETP